MRRVAENDIFHLSWISTLIFTFVPYYPEPHLFKSFKLVFKETANILTYIDILIHLLPGLVFLILLIRKFRRRLS